MRYVVIGGGIVGLATAYQLTSEHPDAAVTVIEKENRWGAHQTGHNSGVIHAGVYYRPDSLKAKLCRAGSASMVAFCTEHDIPVQVCGKLVVATDEAEVPALHRLYERAMANGLAVRLITPAEARVYEPEVACVAALRVPSTGIVNFGTVCEKFAELLGKSGARLMPGTKVTGVRSTTLANGAEGVVVRTTAGDVTGDVLVNCAGLHSDRIARLAGIKPPIRIVPFRGEYYELRQDRRHLVRSLIYPVADPELPFLGVHLTRMINGEVHAGPNAVLALAREGYTWWRIGPRDIVDEVTYPGLWHLARRFMKVGVGEVRRSLSRKRFAASLARLVPAIRPDDLVPTEAGVRAQAINPKGALVDDFLIVTQGRQVHVLNAPSPAATSSLEIGKYIAAELPT